MLQTGRCLVPKSPINGTSGASGPGKLCAFLGAKGKNIDDQIADLVSKGLSPVVQQALDAVRVIGNEAVHPGTLDLKDDVETAKELFALVNLIAQQMISNPKAVQQVYEKLPEGKRKAIDDRNAKASSVRSMHEDSKP